MRAAPIVRPATREDAIAMGPHLRVRDALGDMCAALGWSHEDMIARNIVAATAAYTWEVDGQPACIWGVTSTSLIGGRNIAWLLTTEHVERDPRTFWAGSKKCLAELMVRFGSIEGLCDARFAQSARWLKRLGFRIEAPHDFHGMQFHRFEMGS